MPAFVLSTPLAEESDRLVRGRFGVAAVAALLIATYSLPSAAQGTWPAPGGPLDDGSAADREGLPEQKSPLLATSLSGGTTLALGLLGSSLARNDDEGILIAGLAITALALSVGPSVGHFYVGEVRRGLLHTLIRAALLGGAVAAAYLSTACFEGDCQDEGASALWLIPAAVLSGAAVVHAVYGVVDAAKAAKRFNARARSTALSFAPWVARGATGATRYGLAIGGSF